MEPRSTNTPVVARSFNWAVERRHRSRSRIFTPAYASFDGSNALDLHELLNISDETPLSVTTDGKSLVVSPVTDEHEEAKFRAAMKKAHKRFGRMLKELAE